MANNSRWLLPIPSEPEPEILQIHQITHVFYEEVRTRQALEEYCEWYYETAEKHRQEFKKMENDINPFRWFR